MRCERDSSKTFYLYCKCVSGQTDLHNRGLISLVCIFGDTALRIPKCY